MFLGDICGRFFVVDDDNLLTIEFPILDYILIKNSKRLTEVHHLMDLQFFLNQVFLCPNNCTNMKSANGFFMEKTMKVPIKT